MNDVSLKPEWHEIARENSDKIFWKFSSLALDLKQQEALNGIKQLLDSILKQFNLFKTFLFLNFSQHLLMTFEQLYVSNYSFLLYGCII